MNGVADKASTNGKVDRHLDLDAARLARKEKRGKPPTIRFLGQDWEFPHSMPADVIDLVAEVMAGNESVAPQAIKMLLGGDVYERMVAAGRAAGEPVDVQDMADIIEHLLSAYEVGLPQSSASAEGS